MDGVEGCGHQQSAPSRAHQILDEGMISVDAFSSWLRLPRLRGDQRKFLGAPVPAIWISSALPARAQPIASSNPERGISEKGRFEQWHDETGPSLPAPDWPKIVTQLGSPPNVVMFSQTHFRTATMSSMPTFAELVYSSPPNSLRFR